MFYDLINFAKLNHFLYYPKENEGNYNKMLKFASENTINILKYVSKEERIARLQGG